jgi:hypothetical protein
MHNDSCKRVNRRVILAQKQRELKYTPFFETKKVLKGSSEIGSVFLVFWFFYFGSLPSHTHSLLSLPRKTYLYLFAW